jgi:hypothetical protein
MLCTTFPKTLGSEETYLGFWKIRLETNFQQAAQLAALPPEKLIAAIVSRTNACRSQNCAELAQSSKLSTELKIELRAACLISAARNRPSGHALYIISCEDRIG